MAKLQSGTRIYGTANVDTSVYVGTSNTTTGTGGILANVTTIFIGNNTINTFLTTTGLSVNAVTIANTTGVYTGTVNAASHTTGDGGGASGGLTANVTTINLGNTTVNAVATYSTFIVSNATSSATYGSRYLQISASSGQPTVNLVNQNSGVGGRPAINFYASNTTTTTQFFGGINWLASNAAGSFATVASITAQGDSFTSYKADIVAAVNANSNIVLQAGGSASNTLVGNTTGVYLFTNTFTVGTGTYFVSNGNVGIGTSTPGAKLVITPSTAGTAGTQTLNKIRLFDDGANNVYGFGISAGSMDITSSGTVKIGFNSLTTNTVTNFAQFQSGQLSLTSTDGTTALLISAATKGVRTFSNSTATSIEGVDNTGVGSYQPLYVGGSTVSLTTSNVTRATLSSGGIFTIPYQPSFRAYINSAADTTYTLNTILPFNATAFNVGSNFNTTSSLFTAPVAGIYYFHCFTYGTSSGGAATMAIKFYVNGTAVSNSGQNSDMNIGTGSGQVSIAPVAGSIILSLNASDTVGVYCTAYNGTIFRIYTGQSCFEGYLLG